MHLPPPMGVSSRRWLVGDHATAGSPEEGLKDTVHRFGVVRVQGVDDQVEYGSSDLSVGLWGESAGDEQAA